MQSLNYQIEIETNAENLWAILTELESYQKWAAAFSPQSQFKGEWREGADMTFFDPALGGTRAVIDTVEEGKLLSYHHVAIFTPDHIQDINSDVARKWIGSSESFEIVSLESSVLLKVKINTHQEFTAMFNNGWERALPMIKLLCEQD
ncbi:SRPBCC domain-containing protein [Vibrio sp. SCSIO 43135]|uniref:SRPBCC domain-containing protein n=1 Tax=Vibrio sp. SCSIO 43135 TaxID=2819096 RepID=UPI002074BB40|nr:SRPBCC domain-containing protein [Vibrio sp. SCSIO 43135]USD43835.1 SRPBCC domain-containing protein [Vibrio sp. SCSIO 43135]